MAFNQGFYNLFLAIVAGLGVILTVVGARPQFIKASPVAHALAEAGLNEVIVHTGQHFDPSMSDVFFEELAIPKPAYNLDVHSLGHGAMTGRMLEGVETIIKAEKPDWMLVYGDTNSTLAGALAAARDGGLRMMPPQFYTCAELLACAGPAAALSTGWGRELLVVEPTVDLGEGDGRLVIPDRLVDLAGVLGQ